MSTDATDAKVCPDCGRPVDVSGGCWGTLDAEDAASCLTLALELERTAHTATRFELETAGVALSLVSGALMDCGAEVGPALEFGNQIRARVGELEAAIAPVLAAVAEYEAASARREHLGSYGYRIQDAAKACAAILGQRKDAPRPQERVARWVVSTFGSAALTDRWERACRVVEEAIGLAQAEGLDENEVRRIAARAYSRQPGEVTQEAGGLMVTLLAWAAGRGVDLNAVALTEIERIEKPETVARIRVKQAEKAAAGTGHDYAKPEQREAMVTCDRWSGPHELDDHGDDFACRRPVALREQA